MPQRRYRTTPFDYHGRLAHDRVPACFKDATYAGERHTSARKSTLEMAVDHEIRYYKKKHVWE